jgi:DNA polymerase III alpha subunit
MSTRTRILVAACAFNAALWIAPVVAAPASDVRPGDDAMTCEQIATELAPYAQQIVPNIQALGATQQQMVAQAHQQLAQRQMESAALTPLATAGALDPTGAAKQAYTLALMAQMAKEKSENEAFANSPLAKQNRAQSEQLAAQGKELYSNARLQRLMQLGKEKRCDNR